MNGYQNGYQNGQVNGNGAGFGMPPVPGMGNGAGMGGGASQGDGGARFVYVAGLISGIASVILALLGVFGYMQHEGCHEMAYFMIPASIVLGVFAIVVLVLGLVRMGNHADRRVKLGSIFAGGSLVFYLIGVVMGIATLIVHEEYRERVHEELQWMYESSDGAYDDYGYDYDY